MSVCAKDELTHSSYITYIHTGILLTTNAGDKPTVGKVVAVGPGRTEGDKVHTPNVSAGNTVLYSKYAGVEFEEADKNYIVVRESDILAVLA